MPRLQRTQKRRDRLRFRDYRRRARLMNGGGRLFLLRRTNRRIIAQVIEKGELGDVTLWTRLSKSGLKNCKFAESFGRTCAFEVARRDFGEMPLDTGRRRDVRGFVASFVRGLNGENSRKKVVKWGVVKAA